MSPAGANIIAYVVIVLGMFLLGAYVMRIVGGVRGATAKNDAFLAAALASSELAPGEERLLPFVAGAAGGAHAVWLDLSLRAPLRLAFELRLAVRAGDAAIVDDTFDVAFDEDHDAHGLPPSAGGVALSSRAASMPGSERVTTVLRLVRFDAAAGSAGEVRARVTPAEGVTISRARLLVTAGDAPPAA